MKMLRPTRLECGLTLLEFVVVLFSLLILTLVLLPALSAPRVRNAIGCLNNFKHMGLAFRISEGDHGDRFPWFFASTNSLSPAEDIFESLSNELGNTRILVCPADRRRLPAAGFRTLTSSNISYFINPYAIEGNPQDVVMGDDNLTIGGSRVRSGWLAVTNGATLGWMADRHRLCGNLALSDGSAQAATSKGLTAYIAGMTNSAPAANSDILRLAIP
jgi:hypothetical protein